MANALSRVLKSFTDEKGGGDGLFFTPIDSVHIMRSSKERLPQYGLYTTSLCVVAQGAKEIALDDQIFTYSAGMALAVSVEMPGFGRITKASAEEPYLGMTIEFNVGLMREVLDLLETPPRPTPDGLGLFVEPLSASLQDCILRLAKLLTTPAAIPVLYPSIMREICFNLLTGPHGGEVCKIAQTDSHTRRIADAIYLLRSNFARQVRIEEMAEAARMSTSSFHHHFKTVTSQTPLQFQKQLRLLEARRLMVTQGVSVTSAAYQVGYESASQFSREYARMFGTPPKRDVEMLKTMVVHHTASELDGAETARA